MEDEQAKECDTPDTAKDCPLPSSSRYGRKYLLSPLLLRVLSAALILLGLVVLFISVSTNNWLGDGRLNVGLWSTCMQPGCAADEESLAEGKETLQITRSMMVMAIVCTCVSIFCIGLSFRQHRIFSFSLERMSAVASFAASIFVMTGMTEYTSQLHEEQEDLAVEAEWSYDAGWASFPILFLAGSVTVMLSFAKS